MVDSKLKKWLEMQLENFITFSIHEECELKDNLLSNIDSFLNEYLEPEDYIIEEENETN